MASENSSSKVLPSRNIEPVINKSYPTNSMVYVDHSVEEIIPCKIYPESSDLSSGSSLEFVVHEASEQYLDLGSLKLEAKLRLLDAANSRTAVVPNANVYFTNYLLSALFPVYKAFINNTNVESQYHSHHTANIHQQMEINNVMATNRGLPIGLFPTTSTSVGNPITQAICEAHAKRKTYSKQEVITLKGFINCDIASCNKWLIDGCSLRLVLDPAKATQIINSENTNEAWSYEILGVRLLVNRIRPTRSAFLNTSKYLQNHSLEYIFKQHLVHSEILASGQTSLTIHRPFNSKIPSKLHIFFVDQDAEQGSYTKDRFFYNTNNLSSYRVAINGRVIAEAEFDPNSKYISSYVDSIIANDCTDTYIPSDLYDKGSFILSIKTNTSQPDELMYDL